MLMRWAARHFRQCVAFLLQWAENAGNVGRFPRTCQAILKVWEAYCEEKGLNNPHAPQPSVVFREQGRWDRFHMNSTRLANNSELDIVKRHRAENAERQWRYRQKKKIQQLEEQLRTLREKHETSKTVGGVLSVEWIVRVMLASANTSSRALEETFREATGSDTSRVCRASIGKIKAAFVEVWKSMHITLMTQVFSEQHSAVEAARRVGPACGGPRPAPFLSVVLTHVQDEADMRLLSQNDFNRPGLSRRSRSSKVQMHVMEARCKGRLLTLPVELEALANKEATTLATSLQGALRRWWSPLVEAYKSSKRRTPAEVWLVHCLVGDGIGTNQKAARILWASRGSLRPIRYFLILGVCLVHQTALSATSGVIGRAATTAAAAASDGSKVFQDVTATAVRIFKYLVPEYYEDLKTAAYKWAHDEFLSSPPAGAAPTPAPEHLPAAAAPTLAPEGLLAAAAPTPAPERLPAAAAPTLAPEGLPAAAAPTLAEPGHTPPQAWKAGSWKALQALYTKHVVPDELIKLWTLDNHINGAERKSVEMQRAEFVLNDLLPGDAHPTLSRFFTFRRCVDCMTTMDLLKYPLQGFQVKATARERTQARIEKVRTFFGKPLASQVLRRASLVLQLTSAVEAYIIKNPDKGEPPKLVELLKLKAHVIIN